MRDLSLDDLAGCNNAECRAGCGWYLPSPAAPNTLLATTPCVICRCLGAQHRDTSNSQRPAAPTVPTPAVSVPLASETLSTGASTFPPSSSSFSFGGSSFSSTPLSTFNATDTGPTTSFSATARSMFGSRPGPVAAPPGFRDLADARKADTLAAMRGSSGAFHPALKAQKAADLDRAGGPTGTGKRKKRSDASLSRERVVKPKKAAEINCVFILVPFTKDINRGRCSVFPAHLLVPLEEAGYVKDITISVDDNERDIRFKVEINFNQITEIANHGFRLLVTQRKMQFTRHGKMVPKPGVARVFRAFKLALDVTAIKTAMTDSNIRLSGPRFRRIVFIALNPAGPNLPLRGFTYDPKDTLDHDIPSDEVSESSDEDYEESDSVMADAEDADNESDNDDDSKSKPSEAKPSTDKVPEPQGSRYDTGYFDDDIAAGDHYTSDVPSADPPEPKIEKPVVPAAFLRINRLLHNMQKPERKMLQPSILWSEHGHGVGCFTLGIQSAQICAGVLIQFLASPATSVMSPSQIVAFVTSSISKPFSSLTKLGGRLLGATERIGTTEFEAEFDSAFTIGPGGLNGLAPHILSAFLALPVALQAGASSESVSTVFDELTELSYSLLRCLQHLRFKHPRSQWDPIGGFRELATILENKDSDLPVATEEDFARLKLQLLIEALDKEHPNVGEINFLLMDALGDASNPREMTAERVLKGGEYGMQRFYALVLARVLDELDTAHADYASLLGTAQGASNGVARKIRNYFKRGGATSDPSGVNTGTAEEPSTGPHTRSRSKRTTGNSADDDDSMTNTDSLQSGWENDYSDGEPDVNIRRANRRRPPPPQPRPRTAPSPREKSPPIEISSDSETSDDEEWHRIFSEWRKKHPAPAPPPPTHNAAPSAGPSQVPPPSQSRALPVWLDSDALPEDDITDATAVLRRSVTRYWQGLMREVVERFPHPDSARRITMSMLLAPGMTRSRQYHMLSLAYHVDRNIGGEAHWLRVAGILSQILNDTRKYKLDDPSIVPRESRFH
ncbi:hypothetical protein B0H16DRAFT_1781625 [Mycena metata]|uniref:Uncharacterized protein n=1 Tax=Mycena metata TaxID=1033252 RepID=A0AAD7HQ99_9AGAR|nr:hypothetical protein B0H16DRAFT_1781625 [Mycena metata]